MSWLRRRGRGTPGDGHPDSGIDPVGLPDSYLGEFEEPAGYLDFASIGPVSRRVRSVIEEGLVLVGRPNGPVGTIMLPRYEAALGVLARFMGVPVERVTSVPTTSAGLFQIAFGMLGLGGNVVVPAHEFPANLYPWLRAHRAGGPEVRRLRVPDFRVTPEVVADAVDSNTQAVVVSSVDFRSGFRADLDGLRAAAGEALLVVDAIQGLGAVHAGLGSADVMVAGGQKWMRAGWGSGVMAVSERTLDRLAPTLVGWLGVADAMDFNLEPPHETLRGAARFQQGTPPIFGALQCAAAVEVIEEAGIRAIAAAVRVRAVSLEEVVLAAGGETLSPWRSERERAGILCFRMAGEDPAVTFERLTDAGLVVSRRGDWVRVAAHATTGSEAVGMLREAL